MGTHLAKVVNVASVPKRSPFRYPGGKTWLVPRIRQWLSNQPAKELIEPFAGGGIVTLTAVIEGLVEQATMVELDEDVAAVWQTILQGGAEWLANRIITFELSIDAIRSELASAPTSIEERAFQTILKNRCYRGGILAEGSGLIKYGENGKGIHSRWYPITLQKRILEIGRHRDKIIFVAGDGFQVMEAYSRRKKVAFFIDPPYTVAAKRLYRYELLFDRCAELKGDFLLTYDNAEQIRSMASARNFDMRTISMKNAHHAEQKELLVGRNLSWVGTRITNTVQYDLALS
jgi:DNA adenine methylase